VALGNPGLRPVSLEVEMTAEEFELLSADEAEAILAERYARLTEAGYPPTSALVAATHVEVDIGVAEQLVDEAQVGFLGLHALLSRRLS
jgi:hypothetical protein